MTPSTTCCSPTPDNRKVKWPDKSVARGHGNHIAEKLGDGWFPEKALFNEYRQFGVGHQHDLAEFDVYYRDDVRGLKWPVVNGKETEWRFNEKYDPYCEKGSGFDFYGKALKALPSGDLDKVTSPDKTSLAHKAKIFFRPYAAPPEQPDKNYDLWFSTGRVLEHWHTGTMTRRVPELHRAVPTAQLFMNPADAEARGIKRNDVVWIESRRGKIKAVVETQRPQPSGEGIYLCSVLRRGRVRQQDLPGRYLPHVEGRGLQESRHQGLQGLRTVNRWIVAGRVPAAGVVIHGQHDSDLAP